MYHAAGVSLSPAAAHGGRVTAVGRDNGVDEKCGFVAGEDC